MTKLHGSGALSVRSIGWPQMWQGLWVALCLAVSWFLRQLLVRRGLGLLLVGACLCVVGAWVLFCACERTTPLTGAVEHVGRGGTMFVRRCLEIVL